MPAPLRDGDQPLPTPGQQSVQDALIERIQDRRALGIQRYGSPLMTFNGRNAVQDATEEALDLASYLMQIELETNATRDTISAALKEHRADKHGDCFTCQTAAPCTTRQILTRQTAPASAPETCDGLINDLRSLSAELAAGCYWTGSEPHIGGRIDELLKRHAVRAFLPTPDPTPKEQPSS
ncbi:hypothetical protein E6R60_26410 [Streptomyces sp. A0642]|uniref:hypothetical protein n=1 Tax=Streptomyces sp. A0642 TaxID=2563100 RepID=UPI0010A28641|nr:hypothetical protein [Streptomyces sp. A0642]THA72466.1 hypothetical protein E6R60_26410 [Streptomyces sp. A0642]